MGNLTGHTPLIVISPHLDDGVFGCGQLLARQPGSVVITALAGRPGVYPPLTPWDAAAGFQPGDDVVALRRQEDRAARGHLAARPVWLDFRDAQYGLPPAVEALAAALAQAIASAVQEYRSQLRALAAPGMPGHADVFAPEGYWRLDGRPDHHSALAKDGV